ncbi:MAG: hypothetical protein IT170_12415 [Bryobacterales bacterium]|nr:hypothetical protein [Bryobacterales bacterium]
MTTQTRPLHQETNPRESLPKPPPAGNAKTDRDMMFQSMGQMQESYHGSTTVRRERIFMWIAGIGAGALIFALIYAAIFFLE